MLIEVATFALNSDVSRDAFLAADHDLQERLNSQPGFVRRTTAEGDSRWLVVTFWDDAASADAAADAIAAHEFSALVRAGEIQRYTDIGG